METTKKLTIVKILLTLTAIEFFGPALRDIDVSHLQNPEWPGHARVHMMWLISYMVTSGIANIYLVWFRKPFELRNLYLSFGWQTCNLMAFWSAVIFSPLYKGAVIDGKYHVEIMGINENILAFTLLSSLTAISFAYFHFHVAPRQKEV
ncbi:MAG: hypothetical protein JNJ69_02115 [Leptospiraceae bacterium]|nr:hypothetical protein [Leptospiraceae bacterium]